MILAHPAYERTSSLRMRRTPDLEMSGWWEAVAAGWECGLVGTAGVPGLGLVLLLLVPAGVNVD